MSIESSGGSYPSEYLPGHDPERMIEGWARKHGAGVYGKDHRRGGLEHIEGIVALTILGEYDAAA